VSDDTRLGALQIRVLVLCSLVAMLDGFDTQSIAFVAPILAATWKIEPGLFGAIFAAGLVGIMVGQVTLGGLSDRIGRRKVVLLCVLLFACFSLSTLLVSDWRGLLAVRFLTGVGLGGATPNVIALTSEFAPRRLRATLVTVMFAGFPLGAAAGGLLSSHLIPAYGWESVFVLGGGAPFVLLPLLVARLPESPLHAERKEQASFGSLFADGRAAQTVLFWVACFGSLLMVYFLMSWLPSIARRGGMAIDAAIFSSVLLNVGGAIGGILIGVLVDRFDARRALVACYAVAGISLASVGFGHATPNLLFVAIFVAGFCTIGGQTALNAVIASAYPAQIRGTGLGAALAVGRVGSVVGPVAGGVLLSASWPSQAVFLAAATPALLVCVAIAALAMARRVPVPQ
jgi:MFS transporter, AAHS family, 4-hydroxybenzoate transporter